jgi:hypothetical protein
MADSEDNNKKVALYHDGFDAVDGFDGPLGGDDDDDVGYTRIIKGTQAKFDDKKTPMWQTKNKEPMPEGTYTGYAMIKVVQAWKPGLKAPETQILGIDDKFPNIEELNKKAPKSEWRDKFGKRVGPYEKAYVLYFMHDRTKRLFTFIAATDGACIAIRDLRGSVRMARKVEGVNVLPVFSLGDVHFPTGYGGRQRPAFMIEDHRVVGNRDQKLEDRREERDPDEEDPRPRRITRDEDDNRPRTTRRGVQKIRGRGRKGDDAEVPFDDEI